MTTLNAMTTATATMAFVRLIPQSLSFCYAGVTGAVSCIGYSCRAAAMPSASAPSSGASNGNSAGTSSGGYGTAASRARRRPARSWSQERPVPPGDHRAVGDDRHGEAGAQVEVDARIAAGQGAPFGLGLRGGLDVGGEPDLRSPERAVQLAAEREVAPPGHGGGEVDPILARDAEGTGADGGQRPARCERVEQVARGADAAFEAGLGAVGRPGVHGRGAEPDAA